MTAAVPVWSAESADELEIMVGRLRSLLLTDTLTEDQFVEVTTILDNIAYMFLYLDSNVAHVDASAIEHFREEIFANPQLDQQLEDQLHRHTFPTPEVEEARQRILIDITGKSREPDATLTELVDSANATLTAIEQAQSDLLKRLGVSGGNGSTTAKFYRLQSGTSDSSRRVRLQQAWTQTTERNQEELRGDIDRLVAHRWSTRNAGDSVIDGDLRRSGLSIPTVWDFITSYLQHSIQEHADLEREVLSATDADSGGLNEHFGRFLTTRYEEIPIPKFDVEKCLSYLSHTIALSYGLTVHEIPAPYSSIRVLEVARGSATVGSIHLDLWNRAGKNANLTLAARNRLDWNKQRQQPVARISCRFTDGEDGVISFQNVHSLLHEAGHAVNHLLMVNRIPSTSGLDYLPIERLEHMSMWHEKWAFHADATRFLCDDDSLLEGLGACQDIKKLEYRRTHVDRAVTSALDFLVHSRPGLTLAAAFEELDAAFGITPHCSIDDFAQYFVRPMFMAHPGGYFAYIWSGADSAARFVEFCAAQASDSDAPSGTAIPLLADCFDPAVVSKSPPVVEVFQIYRSEATK